MAIVGVERGSAADDAGLRGVRVIDDGELIVGDIILSLGGQRIEDREDLLDALEQYRIGDRVTLRLLRDDSEIDAEVVLQ